MNIEEFIIQYLSGALDVPVSGDVPDVGTIQRFVTVEKTGSRLSNHIYSPTLAIQSWAESRAEAIRLNEQVKAAMAAALELPEISRSALNSDYNFPDLVRKRPRYQAVYDLVYYERS